MSTDKVTNNPQMISHRGKNMEGRIYNKQVNLMPVVFPNHAALTLVWISWPGTRPMAYPIEKKVVNMTNSLPYRLSDSLIPETYA